MKPNNKLFTQSSFPKLKRFSHPNTAGRGLLDNRLVTPDSHLVKEIEKRIEEQRKDLEERSFAVNHLITHFESLASVCKEEKDKNIDLRNQTIDLAREVKTLKKNLEEKNLALEKSLQKNSSFLSSISQNDYEELYRENDKLKEGSKRLEKECQERFKEINTLHEQISNLKQALVGLEKKVLDLSMDLSVARSSKKKLEEESFSYRVQVEKLKDSLSQSAIDSSQMSEKVMMFSLELGRVKETLLEKDREIQKITETSQKLLKENQENRLRQAEKNNPQETSEKLGKEIREKDQKLLEQQIEIERLNEKINTVSIARKELLSSVEEFRNNSQHEMLRYEKLLQQLEAVKQLKSSEITELNENISRLDSQKKSYIEEIQKLEIQLLGEKEKNSQLEQLKSELNTDLRFLSQNLEEKQKEILEKNRKLEKLHETKLNFKISQNELKTLREEVQRIEKSAEAQGEKHFKEKSSWSKEETILTRKIQALQEELNSEKAFNSLHLKELTKLKSALSLQDTRNLRELQIEEERKFKSRIATLEMDLAEQKQVSLNQNKVIEELNSGISEKSKALKHQEDTVSKLLNELKNPNFLQTAEKAKLLKQRESAVFNEIAKLNYAVQAFENGMTCIVCLNCLENPVLVVPCGHSVCNKCLDFRTVSCPQCSGRLQGQYRIDWLDQLVGKIVFQRQVLDSMKKIIENEIFI